MKEIGRKVRVFRQLAGLRQKELASRVGVSDNYVSLVENLRREPSLKFIGKVADELDLPIAAFFWNDLSTDTFKDEKLKATAATINDLYWQIIKTKLTE